MFEHGCATFEVTCLNLYSVTADATRWLGHVQVEAVDYALSLLLEVKFNFSRV